jgi:hypothetical protein
MMGATSWRHGVLPVRQRVLVSRRQLVADGSDAGPVTIARHLDRQGLKTPSRSTISRILARRAGQMHHLGISVVHARNRVLALADEHHITVIELETGEVLSAHDIDPPAPTGATNNESPAAGHAPQTETYVPRHMRHMRPRHHKDGEGGIRTPDGLKAHTGFRDRRIQPLCHLSEVRGTS